MTARLDVLVVDDQPAIREVLSLRLSDWGHDVRAVESPAAALREIEARPPHLVLCDVVLPGSSGLALLHRIRETDTRMPVVMITAHGTIDAAVEAMKAGATDFLTKPIDSDALYALLAHVARRQRERNIAQTLDVQLGGDKTGIIGNSRVMRELRESIAAIATCDASAIITGESGTGKEVIARAIHTLSARHDKPFVAINAAAIPEGLVESEVFGHEQGAFTGASRAREGCFELAEGGTLFLDEIAEMPVALQPKLLRVLETSRARRLGGSREIRFNVRVVAATNRSAARAIKDGKLREDLFYRLAVFEIVVPPLRVRVSDIPLLSQHFVRELSAKHKLHVDNASEAAIDLLIAHPWPGNVRELRNVIERATIVAREGAIEPQHLPPYLRVAKPGSSPVLTLPVGTTLADAERSLIAHTLDRVDGNKAEAARQLGVDVKTVRAKLRSAG